MILGASSQLTASMLQLRYTVKKNNNNNKKLSKTKQTTHTQTWTKNFLTRLLIFLHFGKEGVEREII